MTVKPAAARKINFHKPGENIQPPSACVFGRTGVGKTSSLANFPGRGLVIETPTMEGQGDAVLSPYQDRITVADVQTWNEIDDIYWHLHDDIQANVRNGAKGEVLHQAGLYHWGSLDTITGMKTLAARKVTGDRKLELDMDPHKITQPEWGVIGQMLSELVYRFTTLWLPFIYIAQEKPYSLENEDGGKITSLGPDMTPASIGALLPVCWVIGKMMALPDGKGGWTRKMYIGPNTRYLTKARSVSPDIAIPQAVLNPNLYRLLNYLLGKTGPTAEIETVYDNVSGGLDFDFE